MSYQKKITAQPYNHTDKLIVCPLSESRCPPAAVALEQQSAGQGLLIGVFLAYLAFYAVSLIAAVCLITAINRFLL